jgi:hypothetical protein
MHKVSRERAILAASKTDSSREIPRAKERFGMTEHGFKRTMDKQPQALIRQIRAIRVPLLLLLLPLGR